MIVVVVAAMRMVGAMQRTEWFGHLDDAGTEAFEHGTFFTRLHHFVLVSDAFVVVPGGIGTLLETAMIWQLLQVRKLNDVPLVLAGRMYADLVEWCKTYMLRPDCPQPWLRRPFPCGIEAPP